MLKATAALGVTLALVGCGGRGDDTRNALAAVQAVASGRVQDAVEDAEQFRKDRIAKGDTVAMSYKDLQGFLPEKVDGLNAQGDPTGQSQAMAGFSMSQAEQTWVGEARADGSTPEVEVTIVDFGGTQQGYAMLAAPVMMGFSREDDQQRMGTVKIDLPHTAGWEEFQKASKDTRFTAVARYRYLITVETRQFGEDKSDLARSIAEGIAEKFADK